MSALTPEGVRVLLDRIKADVDAAGRVDLDVALDALQEVLGGLDAITAKLARTERLLGEYIDEAERLGSTVLR